MIEYAPSRWRSHFFDIKGSMVREIAYRLLVCTLTAVFASVAYHYHTDVAISDKPHALIGPALGLLLVFRTNSANDRFWEGRRLWGGIVNSSRNLQRKATMLLATEPALVAQLTEWTVAFAWTTRHRLVDESALGPTCELAAEAQAQALAVAHPPLFCATQLTAVVGRAHAQQLVSDIQQQMLDAEINALVDHLGGCERIEQTPLPFAYAVHLRRSLVLYCGSLPFALVSLFHEWTALVSLIVSYILIGIEEIGTEIEGPFGRHDNDLPLDAICTRLEANLRAPATANPNPTTALT